MKTAVKWLEDQVKTSKHYFKLMEDIQSKSTVAQSNIFEQAKAIEKQQIIDAFIGGDVSLFNETPEHYYNVTFKDSI